MSIKDVRAALATDVVKGAAWSVLVVLAEHANKDTHECYPGEKTLIRESKKCKRMVKYAIKELLARGLIEQIERGCGSTYPSKYRVNLVDQTGQPLHRSMYREFERTVQPLQENGAMVARERCNGCIENGAISDTPPPYIEPESEPERTVKEPEIYISNDDVDVSMDSSTTTEETNSSGLPSGQGKADRDEAEPPTGKAKEAARAKWLRWVVETWSREYERRRHVPPASLPHGTPERLFGELVKLPGTRPQQKRRFEVAVRHFFSAELAASNPIYENPNEPVSFFCRKVGTVLTHYDGMVAQQERECQAVEAQEAQGEDVARGSPTVSVRAPTRAEAIRAEGSEAIGRWKAKKRAQLGAEVPK